MQNIAFGLLCAAIGTAFAGIVLFFYKFKRMIQ